jgi:hypothetical protein
MVEAQPRSPGARRRPPSWVLPSHLLLLGIVALYFVALLALGGHHAWGRLGVPPSRFTFDDLRSLTTGWECTRRGIDVLPANPCDAGLRPANSPRLWMSLSPLGLGEGSTVALGLLVAVVFLAAAFAVLPSGARPYEAVVFGVAVCSPAVMLGVERGNVDLLLFAVVTLAVLLLRRSERSVASHALLLLAAVLKLFPIFAAGVLLRRRTRSALVGFTGVLIAFAIYALAILDDIRTIERVTPQSSTNSYGIRLVSEWLTPGVYSLARHVGGGSIEKLGLRAWDVGMAALVVGSMLLARRRLRAQLPHDPDPAAERDLDLLVAGAGVYVCSYALFRSFDYRLAFLLLTLPQLLRWARERRSLALVSLASLYGALWLDAALTARVPGLGRALRGWDRLSTVAPFHRPLPLAVVAQLVLFAALVGCLVATAPTRDAGSR